MNIGSTKRWIETVFKLECVLIHRTFFKTKLNTIAFPSHRQGRAMCNQLEKPSSRPQVKPVIIGRPNLVRKSTSGEPKIQWNKRPQEVPVRGAYVFSCQGLLTENHSRRPLCVYGQLGTRGVWAYHCSGCITIYGTQEPLRGRK